MLKKIITLLNNLYHSFKDWQFLLFLFLIAFSIRLPFFFRDYIDRDESTFILMAQSWVDGHLPYTELWDLKPPITFLYFASLLLFFGKSFFAIRASGVLMVALSSFFTYKIGRGIGPKKVAFWCALLLVPLQSLFGSLQGVMSEHISMAFFMMGLYLAFFRNGKSFALFLGGLFLGLAIMTKLNLGYAVVVLFAYVLFHGHTTKKITNTLRTLFIVGLGILLVVLATAVPYILENSTLLWWRSVFEAPMAYSRSTDQSIVKVIPYVILVLVFLVFSIKKKFLDLKSYGVWILMAITSGVLFSFLKTGKANGHYLIQLYPSLILLVCLVLYNTKIFLKIKYKKLVLVIALLLPMESYLEAIHVSRNYIERKSPFNGEGIEIPNYFIAQALPTENLLFFEYHIGYWLLNTKPPSKAATHPSNILREELFPYMGNTSVTASGELQFLMEEKQPSYIVTRKNRRVFDKKNYTANFYVQLQLLKNYRPLDTVDNAVIHKRLKAN